MGTPHKHAEIIKAWADGAEIEMRSQLVCSNKWLACPQPEWRVGFEYRIKPPVKTYGEIAREAWYVCRSHRHAEGDWGDVAHAVIEAYKERNGLSKPPINDYSEEP